MFKWLLLLLAYLPFQIALNPGQGFDLASLRVLIVIFFIIWLGQGLNKQRCPANLQSISLLFFLVLAGFSLIGAANAFWGLRKIVFLLSIFPLYFLVVALVNDWQKIKKIFSVLVVGAGGFVLIGLFQFLSPFVFGLDKVYQFWAWQIVPVFSGFNFGSLILAYPSWLVNVDGQVILRAFSLFSDPHMFSFYLGLILPLVVVLLLKTKRYWPLFYGLYLLLFIGLLLSFTRGAYAAIIITFLVIAGLLWKYLRAKGIALLLCFSLLIFIIPGTPIADRFYCSFDTGEGSNVGRLEMWQQAGQTGLEHFWQGVGLGNYSLMVDADFGYRNPITAHNLYLDIFSEIGLFGLLAWLVLILGTIWQLFTKGLTPIRIGLIGSLVYFSVHSFFETAMYSPPILALLMVILGLATNINAAKNN